MKEKRGLEMAVTTIILIVLSISVLTVLIVFFNSQTGFLSNFFKSKTTQSNVDEVISFCNSLVTRNAKFAYCCEEREVNFGEKKGKADYTCNNASSKEWSSGRINNLDCSNINCKGS